MRFPLHYLCILLSLCSFSCQAQDNELQANILPDAKAVRFELVTDGLRNPWGMAFLSEDEMLVTEKNGRIIRIKGGQIIDRDVKGGPDGITQGQGGLMDIMLHPDFANNQWVYFTYVSNEGQGSGGMTAVSRAKWNGSAFFDHTQLYKGSPNTRAGQHFGSRLSFDREGYLYFTIGDRGQRDRNPQDITRDGGKVYRIHEDGRIPADNPFVGRNNAREAIYSYGHRNPQGMALQPGTGDLWTHEHGPRGGDEVNVIKKGANYGWPVISYGINYSGTRFTNITEKEGMEQPVTYYKPSIAPCGMDFIEGNTYPGWQGHLLVGSLKYNYIVLCHINGNTITKQERIAEGIGRVRSVKQGLDGYIYVGVEGKGLFRLMPN